MRHVLSAELPIDRLRATLARHWAITHVTIEQHHGGMNSATWLVHSGDGTAVTGQRWLAKAVPSARRRAFAAGLALATVLQRRGMPAGAALTTTSGDLVADVDGTALAVLSWVPGEALGTGSADQRLLGAALARVHQLLAGVEWIAGADEFHWVDPGAAHLELRSWLRPAVRGAVAALAREQQHGLTYGWLHTDPAPEAFRRDAATGGCGLIDWSAAIRGPLLYDLASAVMYAGGPDRAGELLAAYLDSIRDHLPALRDEAERALPVLLRFRWAVQADYFARRIAGNDLTGIASAAGNEAGLADAERYLTNYPASP